MLKRLLVSFYMRKLLVWIALIVLGKSISMYLYIYLNIYLSMGLGQCAAELKIIIFIYIQTRFFSLSTNYLSSYISKVYLTTPWLTRIDPKHLAFKLRVVLHHKEDYQNYNSTNQTQQTQEKAWKIITLINQFVIKFQIIFN